MIEEEMKVGPKGQVVIPRALRKALRIQPGSKVVFKLEGDQVTLYRQEIDAVAILEKIARKGRSAAQIPPHLYEEEIAKRF